MFNDAAGKTDREKNILDVKEGYFNGITEGKSFEIYPLGLDWKTIDETISAYKEQNLFNDFFRGIFVDFGREDAFIFNKPIFAKRIRIAGRFRQTKSCDRDFIARTVFRPIFCHRIFQPGF